MARPPFFEQFMVAHACCAAVQLAFIAAYPGRWRVRALAFAIAVLLIAVAPSAMHFPFASDGIALLQVAALLATLAVAIPRPGWPALLAVLGQLALYAFDQIVPDSMPALAEIHSIWVCLLLGITHRTASSEDVFDKSPAPIPNSHTYIDLLLFVLGAGAGALVCVLVLERYILSGDEWANTFQAELYAHFRAYAPARDCPGAFKNWWVFTHEGRAFAQYTPGWPLMMAPLQRLGHVWLAGPVALGVLAVGVARLARRVAAAGLLGIRSMTPGLVSLCGLTAAAITVAGPSMLLNGASRYPHTLICACFAWSVECLCQVEERGAARWTQIFWGAALGGAVGLMFAARPLDGATLSVGVAIYGVYAFLNRKINTPSAVAAASTLAIWGALVLVLLRAQTGRWFTSGYSLATEWKPEFHMPRLFELPNAFRWDKGTAYWWPCSLGLAILGLLAARPAARKVVGMLFAGALAQTVAYAFALARVTEDSGYGPRYNLPVVVPAGVGGGLLLTLLLAKAWPTPQGVSTTPPYSMWRWVPLLAATCAMVLGTALVGNELYPAWHKQLHANRGTQRALEAANLRHAVVVVREGEVAMQAWDETQNLPTDPEPEVLIITDHRAGADFECARRKYADRAWYRASGRNDATITPY